MDKYFPNVIDKIEVNKIINHKKYGLVKINYVIITDQYDYLEIEGVEESVNPIEINVNLLRVRKDEFYNFDLKEV